MKQHRKWLLCLVVVLLVGLSIGWLHREASLDAQQQAALSELESREGQYDAQTIVLSGTNAGRAQQLAELLGAKLRITSNGHFATLTLPEGVSILDIYGNKAYRDLIPEMSADYRAQISELEQEDAEDSRPSRPQFTVYDPGYLYQTSLDYLNLANIWENYQGYYVRVAIIDTGIDTDHPEFAGRISSYSYNATEDHVVLDYGWSAIEDDQGHGTAVAGVLGAAMDHRGTVGVAPSVELLVIKAQADSNGNFLRTSDLVFGMYYAIEQGAQIINMSFGTSANIFEDAIQLAWESNILCVASAGNNSNTMPNYPAADPRVLGVGALEEDGWELADYSNYGDNVDLVAPGTVYTTALNGGYGIRTGTSFSAPAVSGVLALYCSQNGYQAVEQVWEILFAACRDLGSLGKDWIYGYGAVDASAMILEPRGTVIFDMQTDELGDLEQVFIRDHTLQAIPEPERLYAVFDGWYYDPQCTEEYQWYADAFTADLTLYAKWANEDDVVPYTYVTLNDGTVEIRSYTGHRRYITIPDEIDGKTVSSIGVQAFQNQEDLREVHLPRNLKTIGDMAFMGCTNLTQIQIPDSVVSIGNSAFCNNSRLRSVAFGSNSMLTTLGDYAFSDCSSLERFQLPAKLESMNGTALYGATNLEAIGVQTGNQYFAARDSVLFNKIGATLVAYPAGRTGTYQIPDSVRTVGICAFGYTQAGTIDLNQVHTVQEFAFAYSNLETVAIPDTVMSLGASAFRSCNNLTEVTLGNGLRTINANTFCMCSALKRVNIPASVTGIENQAFAFCTSLNSVIFDPNGNLSVIGPEAFAKSALVHIELPSSLSIIASGAFRENYYLSYVGFGQGSVLYSIGSTAFADTPALESIELPMGLAALGDYAFHSSGLHSVTLPLGIADLGSGVFASCQNLTEILAHPDSSHFVSLEGVLYTRDETVLVNYPAGKDSTWFTIPETVTSVSGGAFYGSWNLTRVTIPGSVRTLGEYAFYDCRNMDSYELQEGLEEIGSYAFSRNSRLWQLYLPATVHQVSRYAFAEDYALSYVEIPDNTAMSRLGYAAFADSGLTSFRVPANVSTMGQNVFEGCTQLHSVTFAAGSKLKTISAYTFQGCTNLTEIVFREGSSLTTIAAHGFEGMQNLRLLDFGDAKIEEIGNYAFRFCEKLEALELPETLKDIGRFAFYGCKSLGQLTVPAGLEHIGSYAFHGTNNLNLYFTSDFLPVYLDENWDDGLGGYHVGVRQVVTNGDWKYAVLNSGNLSIVEYLGNASTLDLNKLDLGADILGIGGYAFADSSVTQVILPETLTTIQAYAFAGSKLESVTIPGNVEFIGRRAFADTPVQEVTFSAGSKLRVLEQEAFAGTTELTAVTIPQSLTVMGRRVFQGSGIRSVTFEAGICLETIAAEAFSGSQLTTVTIPDCVTRIDDSAFRDCRNLAEVVLGFGENLYIGSNAFYNTGLTEVHIPANVGYIGEYAFVGLEQLTAFTVSPDNGWYMAQDGLLLSKDGRTLIAVPAGITGSLTVPESVESISFGAFENSGLSYVILPENGNLLTLGFRAFYGAGNLKEIVVPSSVVSIDYYAFANCASLERVIFASDTRLTGVYEGAFYNCSALAEISLPDTVVEISDFAFCGCSSLDRIPVSETSRLKGIYDYAFAYSGIRELVIPDTVTDIGEYAFMGIQTRSITVSGASKDQLTIGLGAFADCNQLEEITLPFIGAACNDTQITWLGYIFGAGGYEANAHYTPESLKTVTVTEGITLIPRYAFYKLENLVQIHLPHSILSIETGAFQETTATYQLTNAIQFPYIQEDIYYYANSFGTGLSGTLKIAEGVTRLDYHMFSYTALEKVILPESLKQIDAFAFYACRELRDIQIPDSVTTMGEYAFYGCHSLTSIVIPDSVRQIPSSCFADCMNLTDLTISNGVTRIGAGAFGRCSSLVTVVLPDSVTAVDAHAFSSCSKLREITLGRDLTELGEDAFSYLYEVRVIYNRSNLQLVPGSEDYSGIAQYAKVVYNADGSTAYLDENSGFTVVDTADGFHFYYENGAYTLVDYFGDEETVTLPLTVNGSTYSIYHLNGIQHVIIPEGFTEINANAFSEFSPDNVGYTLETVVIPHTVTRIGTDAFAHCKQLRSVSIPDSVTEIGNGAFYECSSLESIVLPAGLSALEYNTFAECSGLKEVVLPDNISAIGNHAFGNCTSLSYIYIPQSLTQLDSTAFAGCTMLAQLDIAQGNASFREENGILYNRDMTEIIYVSPTLSGDIRLPDTLTCLPYSGFSHRTGITSVVIPQGITEIPGNLFTGCTSLTSVTIPDSVTAIGWEAFMDCTALETIDLPQNLTALDGYAFANCSSLKEIRLPDSLNTIYDRVFYLCTGLTEVDLPDSAQTLGIGIFQGCTALTRATLPEGITRVPDDIFWECCSLAEIRIPDSVTVIGDSAFHQCSSLESVNIPQGVTEILPHAFSWCIDLRDVVLPDSLTTLHEYAFYGCRALTEFVVPDSVTEMQGRVLYMCSGLVRVTIGNGVTRIPEQTFEQCYALTELTLGTGITEFDSYNYSDCRNLRVIYNNSSLDLTPGGEDHSSIAKNVRKIINADGSVEYAPGWEGFEYLDTAEGYRFCLEDGQYLLLGYLGTEDHLNLPETFNGQPYRVVSLGGMTHVTVPQGIHIGPNAASCNGTIKSLVAMGNQTIEFGAFDLCQNLERVQLGRGVTVENGAFTFTQKLRDVTLDPELACLGNGVFLYSAILEQEEYWHNGCLFIGDHLIQVNSDVKFLDWDFRGLMDSSAMSEAYSLIQSTISGNTEGILSRVTNLETLILLDNSTEYFCNYFGWNNVPGTLKQVVIRDGVDISNADAFMFFEDISIFVEADWIESGAAWDVSYPGWHNGNQVYYGDQWSTVCFYDMDGNLLSREFVLNHQVVRLPHYTLPLHDSYTYTLVGWDLDGDGMADHIPATTARDIHAYPVVEKTPRTYTVTFYDKDGQTPIATQEVPWGAAPTAPQDPEKDGYIFAGWSVDVEALTVTDDVAVYSRWEHTGNGHSYGAGVYVAPTCTEIGGIRHTCTACGEWYLSDTEPALGHSYTVTTVHNCDELGYDLHSCIRCDHSFRDTYTEATGHSYGNWVQTRNASCSTAGSETRTCSNCGHGVTREVPPLPHSNTVTDSRDATCSEAGYICYRCTQCGTTSTAELAPIPHRYERQEVPMDILELLRETLLDMLWGYDGENGYYYVCGDCGQICTAEEAGHIQSATENPDCTHTECHWTVAVEETPDRPGIMWRICELCGMALEAKTYTGIPCVHQWGPWETVRAATREEPGLQQRTCTLCGTVQSEEIPVISYILGDVNSDGNFNGKDLILLRQRMAGWEIVLDEAAADCNCDGVLNGKDLILLRQALAGWDVTLG